MSKIIEKLKLTQGLSNSLSFALIFACGQFLSIFFLRLGQFIILPFSAATVLAGEILNWYEAHQQGYQKGDLWQVVVKGLTGLGIVTSMLGGLIAAAAFAIVGPILAIASTSVRALYFAALAIYYGVSYLKKGDEEDKAKAIANGVNALGAALNAIAMSLVVIALKASFGVLGIVANLIPVVFIVYQAFKNKPAEKSPSATTSSVPKNASAKKVQTRDDLYLAKKEKPQSSPAASNFGLFSLNRMKTARDDALFFSCKSSIQPT